MASKNYLYKKRFRYKDEQSEYTYQLKKTNWKWLWLLLLIPFLLLFVKCERDIKVCTIDELSKEVIPNVNVSISYQAHYMFKNGSFFWTESISESIKTDAAGEGVFEKLPCSVFSYIFYCLEKATYITADQCNNLRSNSDKSLFHYTWRKNLYMASKLEDLTITVKDKETDELLAGSVIVYSYEQSGRMYEDSVITSAAGTCTIKSLPRCAVLNIENARCYGYEDSGKLQINVYKAITDSDLATIRLVPLKLNFSYFVKNKFTKEPIPGALVEVVLTSSNGKVVRGQSITNVDGKGIGAYKDAFVLADLQIKASKLHYKDGSLPKKYIVEDFAVLPDELRTIYLEPEPYMVEFQNVDSITGKPIMGVVNNICINAIDGRARVLSEISNRNGIFYVKAMEGDEIKIDSELNPYYEKKFTYVENFSKGEIIKLKPILTDLTFRTIDGETGELLPQCDLVITTSISGVSTPDNSGTGEFTVQDVRLGEEISIVASKPSYSTNGDKINNDLVIDLMNASQDRRDIPLFLQLPPCDEGGDGVNASDRHTAIKSYNMGKKRGRFQLDWETYSIPDRIQIYNCREDEVASHSPIFDTGMTATSSMQHNWISFSNGPVITVVGTTSNQSGSSWHYYIHCPE